MNTLRAFIAIEMPEQVINAARKCRQALERGGIHLRWVRPENVHLTLRFLGDIPMDTVPVVRAVLERSAAACRPFSIQAKGVGVFPEVTRPKVIWMGLEGRIDLLRELHQRLSTCLAERGFPAEKRPFRGHLTIGRVKERLDSDRLRVQLLHLTDMESGLFPADRLCLFKSDLTQGGAVYTSLVQVHIGSGTSIASREKTRMADG